MTEEMNRSSSDGGDAGKRGPRWGRIVLVVSLALNLAVLGIVGGTALRWNAARDHAPDRAQALQSRDFGFGPFVGAFESADRRALGRAYVRSAGRADVARRQVGEMFRQMVITLKAEPFDRARFESLLLQQQKQLAERQEIGAHLLVEQIDAMSPQARSAYAARLDELLRRPPMPMPHGAHGPRNAGPAAEEEPRED